MSRTIRRYPYGFNKGEKYAEEARADHVPGIHPGHRWHAPYGYDYRKAHVHHGRDGAIALTVSAPFGKAPNCYETWDEVWGQRGKRWAKTQTGRLRRLRDKALIAAALREGGGE